MKTEKEACEVIYAVAEHIAQRLRNEGAIVEIRPRESCLDIEIYLREYRVYFLRSRAMLMRSAIALLGYYNYSDPDFPNDLIKDIAWAK